jgi:pimeloyl-ACP methyl ester carboxylesterase
MKPVLVLIPGLLCDGIVWEQQIHDLRASCDIRMADLREWSSISAMAENVLALNPGPISVAGHSMGARVALEMYRLAPDRIVRLALLDTGIHPAAEDEAAKRQGLVELGRSRGMRALAAQWLPPMVRPGALEQDPELKHALLEMVDRMDAEIHQRQIEALLDRPDARDTLASVRCPILLGVGEFDAWSPPARHREMARLVPHAHLEIFPEAGHMAPMENPEAVTTALKAWMAFPVSGNAMELTQSVRLEIEAQCERLIRQFAFFNDDQDHNALADLFTADGSFCRPTAPDSPVTGREQIRAFFRDRPKRRTRHVMTNTVVDVLSGHEAEARSYVVLYTGDRGDEVLVGDFADRFRKVGEKWCFESRRGSLAFT